MTASLSLHAPQLPFRRVLRVCRWKRRKGSLVTQKHISLPPLHTSLQLLLALVQLLAHGAKLLVEGGQLPGHGRRGRFHRWLGRRDIRQCEGPIVAVPPIQMRQQIRRVEKPFAAESALKDRGKRGR